MGYRSEVAIKCKEDAYKMLKDVCERVDFKPDTIFKDDNQYILHWDWVSWDDVDERVEEIKNTLRKLDELHNPLDTENAGYSYKFIRLGDEYEDIEEISNDLNISLYLTRKIDIPNGLPEVED